MLRSPEFVKLQPSLDRLRFEKRIGNDHDGSDKMIMSFDLQPIAGDAARQISDGDHRAQRQVVGIGKKVPHKSKE